MFVYLTGRKMRECISLFYTCVLNETPPEGWGDVVGPISEIQSSLNMKRGKRQRILKVVVKT